MAKVITRAEWVKIRDEHGIGQGRVSGVSIGKTLDAYHGAKKEKQRANAANAVLAAWVKYSAKLDMKDSGEQQLAREIGGIHIKAAKEAVDTAEDQFAKALAKVKAEKVEELKKEARGLTIDQLMDKKEYWKLFVAFAKAQYANESIEFIDAVDKNMKKEAIYHKFISKDADLMINLPGTLKNKLDDQAEASEFGKMDMNAARTEICKMLKADVLPRFVVYKNFVDVLEKKAEEEAEKELT